jgi:tetratricopeptide (TPR) repeat protein
LVVDFDLEAPGLDSFPSIGLKTDSPGIVEFVSEYLETNISPSVTGFVSECNIGAAGRGHLLLMRSGRKDESYSARLSRIDWQQLYSKHDGYLLFEDLKAQWEQEFAPDYVLIDSRTGHTDVGGICTRQLPNAVVACFLPNDDNILGLEAVVSDIRREAETPARKDIRIHFVPSNVPNLDDEERILARRIVDAKQRLKFNPPFCIIHRYESLSLLDNVIFVDQRRRSRLAKEYRQLASIITQDNLDDRDAVLRMLRTDGFIESTRQSRRSLLTRIEDIQSRHGKDGEVLHEVSKLLRRLGREEDAQALVRESERLGFRSASTVLDSAFRDLAAGQKENAIKSMREALELPNADYYDVSRAIQLCAKADPMSLEFVVKSSSFGLLTKSGRYLLCEQMLVTRHGAAVAEKILTGLPTPGPPAYRTTLMLALIAQGKFESAMAVLGRTRPEPLMLIMADAFNYGMAEWGSTHAPPLEFFHRVLQDIKSYDDVTGRNTAQALAIAAWAVGNQHDAERFLRLAFELTNSDSGATFSAWRYLQVSGEKFRDDLQDVKRMIEGAEVLPPVFAENWVANPPTQIN